MIEEEKKRRVDFKRKISALGDFRRGLFSSNSITISSVHAFKQRRVKAILDFTATDDKEVSFLKGDIIILQVRFQLSS
jgi:hypothetical protein